MKYFILSVALFFILNSGLFRTDAIAQWIQMNGPYGWGFNHLTMGNSTVLAGGLQGIYRSTDDGLHWTEANNGYWSIEVTSLGVFKQNFLAGGWDGTNNLLFISEDNANTWSQVNTINPKEPIKCFAIKDSILFIGTYGDGVYRSTDGGFHWAIANNDGLQHPVTGLVVVDSVIFAGTWGGGVYVSTNNGDNWTMLSLPDYTFYITSLAVQNNKLYAASGNTIYYSTDYGSTWINTTNGLPFSYAGNLKGSGSNLYLGSDQGIFLSTDDGNNWNNIGLSSAIIEAMAISGGNLIAGTRNVGIFVSPDDGVNWTQTGALNNMMVQALAVIDTNLFVGDNGQEGVFISRDGGNSFTEYTNLNHSYVLCLKTRGTDIFAGTEIANTGGGGIFKSSDYGRNWDRIGLQNIIIWSIAYHHSYLFAATDQGVFRTSNEGATWNQVNNGLTSARINAFAVIDTVLFAGTDVGVFKSTNNGTNWTEYGLADTAVTSILNIGTGLFAGTPHGIYANTPPNVNWTQIGLADTAVTLLEIKNTMIFAVTNHGLFISENDGAVWVQSSDSMNNTSISSFTANDTYVFAGTWGEGLWRHPLSEITTGVSIDRDFSPTQFNLAQNYPNPFNPSTVISYQLPNAEYVTLKVYNVLGKTVQTFGKERQNAGTHSVIFNAGDLPSGVYFYTLQAGKHFETKKLLLVK